MFTLHLSRFLSGPPHPFLQKLNSWVHREPYNSVTHCLYWFFVLIFISPLVGMALPWMLFYEMAMQIFAKSRHIKPKTYFKDGCPCQLAVVITGCDSGIGKELAFSLASEGFVVFAGCLEEASFSQFNGMESTIHPIALDVCSAKQVEYCHHFVQKWLADGEPKEKRYLHALINNAGVGAPGYFDWVGLTDFEMCMNGEKFQMPKMFLPIFFF